MAEEEETELDNMDIVIVSNIFKFLTKKQGLIFRQINGLWNQSFYMGMLHRFTVHIDGSQNSNDLLDKFEALLASPGEWQRFSIRHLDLEDPSALEGLNACFVKLAQSLRSIHVSNSRIKLVNFIKLLSIPKRLEELRIVNTSGLYLGGMEVFRAVQCMDAYQQNLANLKRIQIMDWTQNPNPLGTWLERSTRLVELNSQIENSPIPSKDLMLILHRNSSTLQTICLSDYNLTKPILDKMAKLPLRHLTLGYCSINDPVLFHNFLGGMTKLKSMAFKRMNFKNTSFSNVPGLPSLRTIHFEDCAYDMHVLSPFRYATNLTKITFLGTPASYDEIKSSMVNTNPNLKHLVLRLGIGTDKLIPSAVINFKNLISLDICWSGNISKVNLQFFCHLKRLQYLYLNDCTFFELDNPFPISFSLLKRLKIFEMKNSNLMDPAIRELIKLNNLTHVNLENSWISMDGLDDLVHKFWGTLKLLNVSKCQNCILDPEEFQFYTFKLNTGCQFECDTTDDGVEITEIHTSETTPNSHEIDIDDLIHDEEEHLRILESITDSKQDDLNLANPDDLEKLLQNLHVPKGMLNSTEDMDEFDDEFDELYE